MSCLGCSGSAGVPKGVQSLHMGLVHLLREFTVLCPGFQAGSAAFLQSTVDGQLHCRQVSGADVDGQLQWRAVCAARIGRLHVQHTCACSLLLQADLRCKDA